MKYAGVYIKSAVKEAPAPAAGHFLVYGEDQSTKSIMEEDDESVLQAYRGSGIPFKAALFVKEVTEEGFVRLTNTPESRIFFERGAKHADGPEDKTLWSPGLFTFYRASL